MATITSGTWWKAAIMRALRTAAVVAIPYVPVALSGTDYIILASAAGMGFVLSILTSLAGIAETGDTEVSWWYATLSRVVKTVAQALVTAVGSAVLFTDVDWSVIPALVISSAVGSLLLAVTQGVPEAPVPAAASTGATPVEIVAVSPAATPAVEATAPVAVIDGATTPEEDYHGI